MAYWLGIDIGTMYSGAAVATGSRAEIFSLGIDRAVIPTVVLLRDDGEVLIGDTAERRALTEPTRVAREFKRRMGDPTPFIVGGTPYGVEALTAHVLKWILAQVAEQKGGSPEAVVLTHPASWGTYKLDLLSQSARLAEIPEAMTLSEPQSAALRYAREGRVVPGDVVAVYDFGGGTLDVALVRCAAEDRFDLVGEPEGMERLGGVDFDQAVYAHVNAAVDGMLDEVDVSDATARSALARLRIDCRKAKEALSSDTDSVIPVLLPGLQTDVRLTRIEFEDMIRPRLGETIETLERCVRSADLETADLAAVLLVGGTSRIPLIREMVHTATGVPVTLDSHPKFTIALGAALHASAVSAGPPARLDDGEAGIPSESEAPVTAPAPEPVAIDPGPVTAPSASSRREASPSDQTVRAAGGLRRLAVPIGLVALALVVVLVAVFAFSGSGGEDPAEAGLPGTPTSPQASSRTDPPLVTASPSPAPTVPVIAATEPPVPTAAPVTTAPAATPGFFRVADESGTLTVEVPVEWSDVDRSPLYLYADPSPHVSAASSLTGYVETWTTPGISVAVVALDDAGSAESLIDGVAGLFEYPTSCFDGGTDAYTVGVRSGIVHLWFDCAASGNVIGVAVVGDGGDRLYLAVTQVLADSDLAAIDHALATLVYTGG